MKKLFFFLSVLALVSVSCSDDSEEEAPNLLKKKVEYSFIANEPAHVFRYNYFDGNKLENIIKSDDTKQIFAYDGNLIVNIKTYDDINLIAEEQYQYDSENRLVQTKQFNYQTDEVTIKSYTYNADLTATESVYTGDSTQQDNFSYTCVWHFENGQVKMKEYDNGPLPGGIFTYVYTYDDKPIPEQNIAGFARMNLVNVDAIMHNIVWIEQTDVDSGTTDTLGLSYTYNENGMPTVFGYNENGTIWVDGGPTQYYYN
jgi:hypothetical protein